MEHVGKHYEKGGGEEKEDDELRDWAAREGLIRQVGPGKWRLKGLKEDRVKGEGRSQAEYDEDADAEGEIE
jgi:hypothetical protein